MKCIYIMPSFYVCGGNRITIEHCNGLAERGHKVNIICVSKQFELNWIKLHPNIKIYYPEDLRKDLSLKDTNSVVCTYYETFYDMLGFRDIYPDAKLYYFVQQLEDRFFPTSDGKKRVVRTYQMAKQNKVRIITEAKWLAAELKRLYDFDAFYIPNCQNLPEEIPKTIIKTSKVKVLVEGNAEAPGKGVQDAWEAVKDINCFKVLLTNSPCHAIPSEYKFDEIFCRVPWEKALSVIKACDILVKPSHYEGSPTPLMEAWELGTAVVTTKCTGWDEYGLEEINCLTCEIEDIPAMRDKITQMVKMKKDNEHEWYRFIKNGEIIAKKEFSGWKKSIDKLENIFLNN